MSRTALAIASAASASPVQPARRPGAPRRPYWLAAALLLVVLAALSQHVVSWRNIGLNYEAAALLVGEHRALATTGFVALYIVLVTFSLPGGGLLTIAGGMLFGWLAGSVLSLVAATAGGVAVFLAAGSAWGRQLTKRFDPWLVRLKPGFRANGVSYLVVLRLMLVPAFLVNLVSAVMGLGLRPFLAGTVIGSTPPIAAFAYFGQVVGKGIAAQNDSFRKCLARHPLDASAACPYGIDWSAFPAIEFAIAAGLIGAIALMPIVIKKRSMRHVAV